MVWAVIFLDVGAHEGQTLEEVLKPEWGFGVVHAYEPMPTQFGLLTERFRLHTQQVRRPALFLHGYGLSSTTGQFNLYGNNDGLEASLYPQKVDVDERYVTPVQMVRATDVLASFREGTEIIMKINAEGGEVPILWDLIESGAIHRLRYVMIDFDCRKVPGLDAEEGRIRSKLEEIGFDRCCDENVMIGAGETHQERTAAWLRHAGFGS